MLEDGEEKPEDKESPRGKYGSKTVADAAGGLPSTSFLVNAAANQQEIIYEEATEREA